MNIGQLMPQSSFTTSSTLRKNNKKKKIQIHPVCSSVLTLNIPRPSVSPYRLKRSWFPFRRSEPTGSSTCWSARSGRSTASTWRACGWASATWAPWTFPRTTTDEGAAVAAVSHSPQASVCLRTPSPLLFFFYLTWQCRCSLLLTSSLKHTDA